MIHPEWREPITKAFSVQYQPEDYSCDNAVLFTAHAHRLGIISLEECEDILNRYQVSPGLFIRHPMKKWDLMHWDDHVGAAAISPKFAVPILDYAENHGWMFGENNLSRFPIFAPILRAGGGRTLSLIDQLSASLSYLANIFEAKSETSGKLILWLCSETFRGKGRVLAISIDIWKYAMARKYVSGPREMFQIYFPDKDGHRHPFVNAAPVRF